MMLPLTFFFFFFFFFLLFLVWFVLLSFLFLIWFLFFFLFLFVFVVVFFFICTPFYFVFFCFFLVLYWHTFHNLIQLLLSFFPVQTQNKASFFKLRSSTVQRINIPVHFSAGRVWRNNWSLFFHLPSLLSLITLMVTIYCLFILACLVRVGKLPFCVNLVLWEKLI